MRRALLPILLRSGQRTLLQTDFANGVYNAIGATISVNSLITVRATPTVGTLDKSGNVSGLFTANQPRLSNRGLGSFSAQDQIYLDNANPIARTRTITNGSPYVGQCFGPGNITFTGGLAGVATQGNPQFMTATTTSVTITPNGGPTYGQLQDGVIPQPPIIAGTGGAATSGNDAVSMDLTQFPWFSMLKKFTILVAYEPIASATQLGTFYQFDDGTTNNRLTSNYIAASQLGITVQTNGGTAHGYDPALPWVIGNRLQAFGVAFDFDNLIANTCLVDAVQGVSPIKRDTGINSKPLNLANLRFGGIINGSQSLNGYVRELDVIDGCRPEYLQASLSALLAKHL